MIWQLDVKLGKYAAQRFAISNFGVKLTIVVPDHFPSRSGEKNIEHATHRRIGQNICETSKNWAAVYFKKHTPPDDQDNRYEASNNQGFFRQIGK